MTICEVEQACERAQSLIESGASRSAILSRFVEAAEFVGAPRAESYRDLVRR